MNGFRSNARSTSMKLKSAAKLSSVIWLTTKHANCRMNAKQSPCTVTNDQCVCTAFAQRPLCALCVPAELLLRCRRPYCAAMVTPLRSIRMPSERRVTVFVLSVLKVGAIAWRSMRSHRVQWRCHCAAAVMHAFVLRAPRRSAFFKDAVGSP